ncbi:MAG: cytochrome c biogenesis protein CcsA [Bacteroidetes bacterium]|nr:cytochrome c biogenesis protein CcsA [Bacteroidota bacterium]
MLGTIGKLLILIAIVSGILSGFTFLRAARIESGASDWKRIGRYSWLALVVSIASAFGILVYLNITHQFQYAYTYENTSLDLPLDYLVASTWAGQEGSFLLWILLNGLVGISVMKWAREYEAPVMAIIALCQVFLISMVVGVQIGPLEIGASPFATLVEKFPTAPMMQAGIIPTDGQGLNDLLQNYWMVIHPPILFSGFASMIVPFAFAITALWKKNYQDWVRPALPWSLFGVATLGVGITLGGYWAYITLSFGGYWAWDPVENSSLVPWLLGIAAIHTMIVQKRSGHSHRASFFLTILAYILVVYSTFLTRSGILGDISVHSFVDLGLYNQLLIWILSMSALGFGLFFYRLKDLPKPGKEPEMLSREFMIFTGAMLVVAVAMVVLVGTSAPILGRIFKDNPSTVPLAFYNKWTLPLTIVFMFLAGLGQLFWWNKMTVETVNKVLFKPIILAAVSTIALFLLSSFRVRAGEAAMAVDGASTDAIGTTAGIFSSLGAALSNQGPYLLLLLLVFVAFFALYGNGEVLWKIAKGNLRLAGGAAAHVGFAILVLGIVTSSGLNNPIGKGGVQLGETRDNFVLALNQTLNVQGYTVSYTGHGTSEEGLPTYLLSFTDPKGRSFDLAPVVYESNKGQWIQNPDIQKFIEKDIFVAVSPNIMFDSGEDGGQITIARGDSSLIGNSDYLIEFLDYDMTIGEQYLTDSTEVAVGAILRITKKSTGEAKEVRPVYLIQKDRSVEYVQNTIEDWGITIAFTGMNVDSGSIVLGIQGISVTPEDWIVVQAYEKPFISLVWIGFIILTLGFFLSIYRRAADQKSAYDRASIV